MRRFWFTLAMVLAFAAEASLAQSSPWNGTWKLNDARTDVTKTTFTFAPRPGGGYKVMNSGRNYEYACDGKEYPLSAGMTVTCTHGTDTEEDSVTTLHGEVVYHTHRSLSPDGKTMTVVRKGITGDGKPFTETVVSTRAVVEKGFAGNWTRKKDSDDQAQGFTIMRTVDRIHVTDIEDGNQVDAKLDGSDAKMVGQRVMDGAFEAYKPDGPRRLTFVYKLGGKSFREGSYTLSADGRTIEEVSWFVSKPADQETYVYEKQ